MAKLEAELADVNCPLDLEQNLVAVAKDVSKLERAVAQAGHENAPSGAVACLQRREKQLSGQMEAINAQDAATIEAGNGDVFTGDRVFHRLCAVIAALEEIAGRATHNNP